MNRQSRLVFLFLTMIALVGRLQAQNVLMPWSAFTAGGGRAATQGIILTASHGQAVVGRVAAANLAIQSGFLATPILLGPITGIPEQPSGVPSEFGLSQNFPNPFNPSTTIRYQLPVQSHVTLKVYDILGREVSTLVDDVQEAGETSVVWNADRMASGAYFYRLETTGGVQTRRLMLLR